MSRTLLSHEWLALIGGSENVFEELIETFPEADRVCLWNDAPGRFGESIRETWLARSPLRRSKAAALPLMRSAWKRIDLDDYERVIASSHAFGHHLAGRAAAEGRRAFAYVHSPARYIWAPEHDDRGRRALVRGASRHFRRADIRGTNARVQYAANSEFVRDRIRSAWDQDSRVIYPPVDVERLQAVPSWREVLGEPDATAADGLPDQFVLGASRFVEYKRLDLVISVGENLGLPVVLAGAGPDEDRLRHLAGASKVPVHFVGRVSNEMLYWLYSAASLFVFLAIEDFGIMPVEAMALGTPTLVNSVGGAKESVSLAGGGASVDVNDHHLLATQAESALLSDMTVATRRVRAFSVARFRQEVATWASPGSVA